MPATLVTEPASLAQSSPLARMHEEMAGLLIFFLIFLVLWFLAGEDGRRRAARGSSRDGEIKTVE
jgi:hypothetical protein